MEIINPDAKSRILRNLSKGYEFDINRYFNEGWELFKRAPGVFIGFTVVYLATIAVVGYINENLSSIVNLFVTPIAAAGYYTAASIVDRKGHIEFNDFFHSMDRYWQLFLLNLVVTILSVIGLVLLIIPGIWFMVAVMFGYPLVALGRLGFIDSIEVSIRVINKKWFHFLLLGLLIALVLVVGVLACGVGILAAIPLAYCILYACYRHVIGSIDGDEGLNLEDHLITDF